MKNESKIEAKNLNLFDIICLGFGGAIGSGIFVLMGSGINFTGKSIVLAVGVGCLFMLLAYFYNVLLSSMFTFKGGDYSQKAITFNPFFSGISAYVNFTNGFSIAMYSIAIINYASIIFPTLLDYSQIIAIFIITLLFAATIRGSKFISTINSIMTVILIISIFIFIVFGVSKVQSGYFSEGNFFRNGFSGFISAIAIMGWACQGTTMGPVAVSAVTKKAKKNIPLGILLVTVLLAVVYFAMSYVAAGVLPIEEVSNKNLSLVAKEIFPYWIFVIFIIGGAVFAIATSMITAITMVRYPILKVAEDGWLPKICKKTTSSGYPWVVYLIFYIVSIVPVLLGFSLDVIVSLVMIPYMITNIYCNLACIRIINKYPKQWENSILHMPKILIDIICILAALSALIVCYNLFILLDKSQMLLMLGILFLMSIFSTISIKTGNVSIENLEKNKEMIIQEALNEED